VGGSLCGVETHCNKKSTIALAVCEKDIQLPFLLILEIIFSLVNNSRFTDQGYGLGRDWQITYEFDDCSAGAESFGMEISMP
jgi:hypothetical protein